MPSDHEIRAAMKAHGLRIKRNNLIAATLSGVTLGSISLKYFPRSMTGILLGILAGFVYANGFEYCLHRFLLHSGRGIFAQQHMVHHTTLSSPEAARYVNFSSNPLGVVALFFVNAIPFLAFQWALRNEWPGGWGAGVFASFAMYYVAFEEIHWRTHMDGWLPKWLKPAARHHLLHHAHDAGRFNVFFPLFDRLMR
jgi:drug/metabolite transporter (DMT)-like permease